MKPNCIWNFILLTGLISILSGCEQKIYTPQFKGEIIVMKLNNPLWKDYILANYNAEKDLICEYGINRCEEATGFSGNSPYWELPDSWLLIDWKWWGLPYDDVNGLVILTDKKWEMLDVTISSQTWSMSEPHIFEPVDKIHYIASDSLEKYAHAIYGEKMKELIVSTHVLNNSVNDNCLCDIPEAMDSIWTILQRDLSIAIENDDLQKLAN